MGLKRNSIMWNQQQQALLDSILKGKATPGSVVVIESNKRLQLRFRLDGKRQKISLGLADTKENRRIAQIKAGEVERDIALGRHEGPEKYKQERHLTVVKSQINSSTELNLPQLWQKYTKYKSKQLSESTIAQDYHKIARRLELIPSTIKTPVEIRDWLLEEFSSETARRTLVQINACSNWAVDSKLIKENGFRGMATDIKKTAKTSQPECFSLRERGAILNAFEHNTYCPKASGFRHSYYHNFIQFLWLTGCRLEEAIALRWGHITPDCSRIRFEEAVSSNTRILGWTKTNAPRTFPCNPVLQAFLKEIQPEHATADMLMFPAPKGGYIDSHNVTNRVWRPILEGLVKDRKVYKYLPLNNIRHSFITACLETGKDAKDVARWVGNSPEVIYRNYAASNKRDLAVPVF